MTKLTDTQTILLSTASQRESGSLYPLPSTLRPGGGTAKSIAVLTSVGFAEERETIAAECVSRTDSDLRYGLFITAAGLRAIGAEGEQPNGCASSAPIITPPPALAVKPTRNTKIAVVLAMLQRPDGATLTELIEATGWLPHTTRAALTGLKKKHAIERRKRDNVTCYHLPVAEA